MSSKSSTQATVVGLAVVGLVLTANGAWYAPIMFGTPADAKLSEYGGQLPFRLFQAIQFATLVALAVVVSRIGPLSGPTGRHLPRWVPTALVIVTILNAATVYAQAFVVPHLARIAPAALDNEDFDLFAMSMMAIWVAYSLTFVVVAVIGAIRRVIPVAAAVPIAFGALSMPILGPAGALLIGGGLLFWALSRLLRPAAQPGATLDARPNASVRVQEAAEQCTAAGT